MSMAARIREAMGDMRPADLARRVNVTPASVTQWLDGSTKTLRAETANLLEVATGYRASWIVTGKGPKTVSGDFSTPSFSRGGQAREPTPAYGLAPILAWEHEDDLPPGEFVMVPLLNVHLSAGGGRNQIELELTQQAPIAFRADFIRAHRLNPRKLAAMTAVGDSMVPSIYDGDVVLVDTAQTDVQDGKVYALWYDGGERVKRLYRLPGGGLRIKSDNAEHAPIELGPDYAGHVRIIGRVLRREVSGGL